PRMSFFEHLEELRKRGFRIFLSFIIFFAIFLTFSLRFVEVGGVPIPYLWPDFFNSVSIEVLRATLDFYLPDFVPPIQIEPAEAIVVQFKVAGFLAILFSMPVIVHQVSQFVAPGLYAREKKIISRITVPATLLFLAGVLVSHFLILPFVFDFLYTVGVNIGFATFARADPVFDIVLLFFLGMGLAFQTPVIMWGLTALGVVEPSVWKRYWRYAIIGFFLFGAVITPDGSGLTMALVAFPMSVLYGIGYILALRTWRQRQGPGEKGETRSSPAVWSAVIILVGAVVGGFVYFGTPLFVPPGPPGTPISSGVVDLSLPAFVLYSSVPLAPSMETGATLTANGETVITYMWSGATSDGIEVEVALNATGSGPFDPGSGGSRLVVFPVRWTSADRLQLSVAAGNAGVYVLNVSFAYTLYDLGNRLLLAYEPTPTSAALLEVGATSVAPPIMAERTLLEGGQLSSLGGAWELAKSVDEVRAGSATFSYDAIVAEVDLGGRSLSLSLTRSFAWTPNESHDIWVRGTSSADFAYAWYVDLRFGTLYPVLDAP
ncbi:MAG: twin-arginine translocase subunit TatC, partial [Thermoplasmata archaeon]